MCEQRFGAATPDVKENSAWLTDNSSINNHTAAEGSNWLMHAGDFFSKGDHLTAPAPNNSDQFSSLPGFIAVINLSDHCLFSLKLWLRT